MVSVVRPYGCHNRPDLGQPLRVQTGWIDCKPFVSPMGYVVSRLPTFEEVPFAMTTECQYSLVTKDERCVGCRHNQQEKGNGNSTDSHTPDV